MKKNSLFSVIFKRVKILRSKCLGITALNSLLRFATPCCSPPCYPEPNIGVGYLVGVP